MIMILRSYHLAFLYTHVSSIPAISAIQHFCISAAVMSHFGKVVCMWAEGGSGGNELNRLND